MQYWCQHDAAGYEDRIYADQVYIAEVGWGSFSVCVILQGVVFIFVSEPLIISPNASEELIHLPHQKTKSVNTSNTCVSHTGSKSCDGEIFIPP